ncbi:MAG TPA: molybdate ABC transporter substrate-binding protein [Rhodobacteraceae bacterium]|jgi:molybdate transport system substrate-binding protein|nr:molybdate ABC transporter substrate-binding protein [Paracoccaceae bacterium]
MMKSALLTKTMAAVLLFFSMSCGVLAGEVTVAVASNFLEAAQKIVKQFKEKTGHQVYLVNGSTGALFAQISNGAPYDVFLSADQARILRLKHAEKLLDETHKTYALGKLVLFAKDGAYLCGDIKTSIESKRTRHFAMADPATAPYGLAAQQVLERLGLLDRIKDKAVVGVNIGQAFGFVATGNAQVGFVALSQAMQSKGDWIAVSDDLYVPIVQEAGLLLHSKGNEAAREFYDFLSSKPIQSMLQSSGFEVPK